MADDFMVYYIYNSKLTYQCICFCFCSTTTDSNLLEPGKEADCYNGAILEKYTWSQTIKDIDLKIPVPKCVQRARDVSVNIKNTYLRVALKGNVPLEGE